MTFKGFTHDDFNVFSIAGLEARMDALKSTIRPKLDLLGVHFAPTLTALAGEEMFVHVAKHARRTKNPPNDTWVAFASNPRGYKMLPHFQIGLWETHLFIWYAVIYECPLKGEIGTQFEKNLESIYHSIPENFVWSKDHTKPGALKHQLQSKDDLLSSFQQLQSVKKAELLCGLHIERDEVVQMGSSELLHQIDSVFRKLLPLYKLS